MNHRNLAAATLLAFSMVAGLSMAKAHDPAPSQAAAVQLPDETPFLTESDAAMDKMMAGMDVAPTGNVDTDFSAMMIPHHQGAIDMALAYLRYGKNEQLRRIAQEIIVDQQQEIAAMRLALGQPLPPSAPAPTQIPLSDQPAPSPMRMHDHGTMTQGSMTTSSPNQTTSSQTK